MTLSEQIRVMPYFDQLFVLNPQGELLAAYPRFGTEEFNLLPQEYTALRLVVQGVPFQSYAIPPSSEGKAARISFLAAILDGEGIRNHILLGRSELTNNPLAQPLINSLQDMGPLDGEDLLLDGQGLILDSSNPENLINLFAGDRGAEEQFSDLPAPDGTRNLVYYQPVIGGSWAVVLIVPPRKPSSWLSTSLHR